jgi:hypothetical protein
MPNHACRHVALIDVSGYPADTEVPSFDKRAKCNKCGPGAWTCGQTGKKSRFRGSNAGAEKESGGEGPYKSCSNTRPYWLVCSARWKRN